MLKARQMPLQADPLLLARLKEVDPTTIGHFRHYGFIDPALRALIPGRRVVGNEFGYCNERSSPMPAGGPDKLKDIRSGLRVSELFGANARIDPLPAA